MKSMNGFLSFYALDLPRFETFIEQSLDDILWYYAEHGVQVSLFIPALAGPESDIDLYLAMPGTGLGVVSHDRNAEKQEPVILRERPAESDPFLELKARDYLARQDSSTFKELLNSLSLCPTIDFIKPVIVEERSWWLASFLDYLQSAPVHEDRAGTRMIDLTNKILRGSGLASEVPGSSFAPTDFRFPVLPAAETDFRMGIWTEREVLFVIDYLRSLPARDQPRFYAPTGFVDGDPPIPDREWNEWVYDNIARLLQIESYGFEQSNIVSFIRVD